MKTIVAAIIFTLLPLISFSADNDRSTTVRDRDGNIIRTEQYEGRQKIIHDRFGHIIGTEEND